MADVFGQQEKPVHKQGPNWDVVGRFEDFESADKRRKKEISEGKSAKVQHLSSVFVVKVKPQQSVQKVEVVKEAKSDKPTGKQKRQDRDAKR